MKAAVVSSPGAEPEYADFPEPVVGDGSELARRVAAGIHPVVRALASGRHYGSSDAWPMVPASTRSPTEWPRPRASVRLPPEGDPLQVAAGVNPGLSSWLPLRARVDETGGAGLALRDAALRRAARLGPGERPGASRSALPDRRGLARGVGRPSGGLSVAQLTGGGVPCAEAARPASHPQLAQAWLKAEQANSSASRWGSGLARTSSQSRMYSPRVWSQWAVDGEILALAKVSAAGYA